LDKEIITQRHKDTKPLQELFPIEPAYPPGFQYQDEFISVEEERLLLEVISKTELHTFIFQGYEAKRRVSSFGYDYSFDKRELQKGKPIPDEFNFLTERVAKHLSIDPSIIVELLIIEYPVGAVINWHRDAPPFDIIAGISLLSDCKFKLRPYDKSKQGRSSVITVPVRRRSLYIMSGESRSDWEHSTAPLNNVRYSITLRTLRAHKL
jgi:alkylated DNA repair dioxygenase AlkB